MTQGGKNLNEVSWIHHSEGFRSEILHRLIDGKHPIICRLSTLLSTISDAGFRNHPELLPKKNYPKCATKARLEFLNMMERHGTWVTHIGKAQK